MLFGLWGRLCAKWEVPAGERDAERERFTGVALLVPEGEGVPSWAELSKKQVDGLKHALQRALGNPVEGSDDAGERARLVFAIGRDSAAAYGGREGGERAIASICADVHGPSHPAANGHWRRLPLYREDGRDLRNLAITCARAARRKAGAQGPDKAAGEALEADKKGAAGVENYKSGEFSGLECPF